MAKAVWITRSVISAAHFDGMRQAIKQAEIMPAELIRIEVIPEGSYLEVGGQFFQEVDLPAQGILLVAEE